MRADIDEADGIALVVEGAGVGARLNGDSLRAGPLLLAAEDAVDKLAVDARLIDDQHRAHQRHHARRIGLIVKSGRDGAAVLKALQHLLDFGDSGRDRHLSAHQRRAAHRRESAVDGRINIGSRIAGQIGQQTLGRLGIAGDVARAAAGRQRQYHQQPASESQSLQGHPPDLKTAVSHHSNRFCATVGVMFD